MPDSEYVIRKPPSSLAGSSSSSSSSSSGRFQVWGVSPVIQQRFKQVAQRLYKKISEATEEALIDWVQKHHSEANIPLEALIVDKEIEPEKSATDPNYEKLKSQEHESHEDRNRNALAELMALLRRKKGRLTDYEKTMVRANIQKYAKDAVEAKAVLQEAEALMHGYHQSGEEA